MRWIRKSVVIGLAAFGVYRVYEIVRARVQIATPPVSEAFDTVKTTAAKVRDDLAEAQTDIVDELKPAIAPDEATAPEPRMAVADPNADVAANLA